MVILFVLSIIGLIASIGVHIATFFPSQVNLDAAWVLNGALCAVWTPLAMLGTQKLFDLTTVGQKWVLIPRYAPEWTKRVAAVMLFYAMFNFFFTMIALNNGGFPAIVDGQMVLHTYNFGRVISDLTPSEYAVHMAYITRVHSGHWIFFFWMGLLASHSHLVEASIKRTVPQPAVLKPADQVE